MINLKNAKEVKEKVEEVKKKRPVEKIKKVEKKKVSKKEQEKIRKRRFILTKLFIFEVLVCSVIVVTSWCLNTMQEYYKLYDVVNGQNVTINNLTNWLRELSEQQEPKIEEKKQAYNITPAERELLAKLLYHEARGESLECQKAVTSVILNRVESGKWGDSLEKVIYAKNQFEPVSKGLLPNTKPLAKQYEAIDYVIENGATVPANVLYFRADKYFDWGTNYMAMDNTYFSM